MKRLGTVAALLGAVLAVTGRLAAEDPGNPTVANPCAAIRHNQDRLACYDALARGEPFSLPSSFLERHWDLQNETRRLRPWPMRPSYVLPIRFTNHPNQSSLEPPDVQPIEAKFQISFKTILLNRVFGGPGKLWFGYTQQSHFQIYNHRASRPFRETDFEPEILVAFPARRNWGPWSLRVLGFGFVHQSNGRSDPLSRSWNRVYGLAAAERGSLVLHVRSWVRVDRAGEPDDNPRINDFIGRADLVAQWSPGRQVVMFRGRSNLDVSGHRGSLEANWFFPIRDRLRGSLQVFTGYGESLIDYDHGQTTIGLGLLLFDPF